jgi:hypothetical protein
MSIENAEAANTSIGLLEPEYLDKFSSANVRYDES